MNSLDNYIYYSLCEKSYELFKMGNYSTYRNFCKNIKNEIEMNKVSHSTTNFIFWKLGEYLKMIYGFDFNESLGYIIDYFLKEKYKIFEEPMICIASAYKNSFN